MIVLCTLHSRTQCTLYTLHRSIAFHLRARNVHISLKATLFDQRLRSQITLDSLFDFLHHNLWVALLWCLKQNTTAAAAAATRSKQVVKCNNLSKIVLNLLLFFSLCLHQTICMTLLWMQCNSATIDTAWTLCQCNLFIWCLVFFFSSLSLQENNLSIYFETRKLVFIELKMWFNPNTYSTSCLM